MKTQTIKTVIAIAAGVFGASTASPVQARLPDSVEVIVPAQNETIYRPTCWTEDGYERWLRCAAAPGGIEEHHPRIKGGYRGQ